MIGLQRPFLFACAMGHATIFVVNAALMVNQWQSCALTVPLYTPINVGMRLDRSQAPFFKFLVRPDQESSPVYQIGWHVLNQQGHLTLWRPAAFGDFRKKRLKARGFILITFESETPTSHAKYQNLDFSLVSRVAALEVCGWSRNPKKCGSRSQIFYPTPEV